MNLVEMYKENYSQKQVATEVLRLLDEQGTPAFDSETSTCVYRHPTNGTKCAVGLVLPDTTPDHIFAFTGSVRDILYLGYTAGGMLETTAAIHNYLDILEALQELHDSCTLSAQSVDDGIIDELVNHYGLDDTTIRNLIKKLKS